jgi:phosphoribosylanthranilate isomerase
VKVCGVTRPQDAALAVDLGADFVGLNFWPRSPRAVDPGAAREIAAAVGGRASLVGLFVNESPAAIEARARELALDLVQLHGDETEADLERFAPRLLRVERSDCLAPLPAMDTAREPASAHELGVSSFQQKAFAFPVVLPRAFLLDAPRDGRYGGTGMPWVWGAARDWIAACPRPVLVAGGVRPENVAAALAASGAAGVDVASGVESSPGVKDAGKLRRLFEEVRGAATRN